MNPFSTANLAVVAYAEVDGPTGASTATNSGVTTTRTSTGIYLVALPTLLSQEAARDLILVQAKGTALAGSASAYRAVVDDSQSATKVVSFGTPGRDRSDCSFSILILRTLIPPPVGAPA